MMFRHSLLAFMLSGCLVGDASGPTPSSAFSGATELYGINAAADGTGANVVEDLGAQWVRLELIEQYDLDAALAPYNARGIRVLLIVDYASVGGNPGFGCAGWDAWRDRWLARVGEVAQQFGSRIAGWEIWNEPDHPMLGCGAADYNPGMPAADYGLLLRDAAAAIRNAGATGSIVIGGLDSGQTKYVRDASYAAGGLAADAVGIHPYGVVPDASWCPDGGEDVNCDWGTLGGKVDEYRAASGLPVWVTEFGVKTGDTAYQAAYLRDAYAAFAAHGAQHAFVFCESDAMVAPFGLTYADRSPKPDVYAAYQALARGAAGHTGALHGTVRTDDVRLEGVRVTAWGHNAGDFHETWTDALGIYAFTDLSPDSLYNVVVNAQFAAGGYEVTDDKHNFEVRDNVELIAGPDDWHGEDFVLAY